MVSYLKKQLKSQRLVLVCGSGGVGKTTLSAALGLQEAIAGKRVLVLTIDPARRLANSLGLSELDDKPRAIDIQGYNPKKQGALFAMMLDTKSSFDRLIAKYSPDDSIRDAILQNSLYQSLSTMVAGSQEYMAMEELHAIYTQNEYDLLIVDTPPTVHALDFLKAPEKMIQMIDHSMLKLLLKPAVFVGKTSFRFFEKGSRWILKVFDKITGFDFLKDLSEMLQLFEKLIAGFQSRASEVRKILAADTSSFLLVTGTEKKSIRDAELFAQSLSDQKFKLASVIVNRISPFLSNRALEKNQGFLNQKLGDSLGQRVGQLLHNYQKEARYDQKTLAQIKAMVGLANDAITTVPLFQSDIHSLDDLHAIGSDLYN